MSCYSLVEQIPLHFTPNNRWDSAKQLKKKIARTDQQHLTSVQRLNIDIFDNLAKTGLGWKVLMYPPNSPDLAPWNYHWFWSMQNFFNGVKLPSMDKHTHTLRQEYRLAFLLYSHCICYFYTWVMGPYSLKSIWSNLRRFSWLFFFYSLWVNVPFCWDNQQTTYKTTASSREEC